VSTPLITAGTCARAPQVMTVAAAHAMMQAHLTCRTETCAQRRTALQTLADASEYVLADGAPSRQRAAPLDPAVIGQGLP
jgi:hypothetical protein